MNNPLISIILPLYNGRCFIEASVKSVLHQSYDHFELLVIDDGSSDGGSEMVPEDPRIRFFPQQNVGVAATRNFGISQAESDFIAFIDQDDYWYPNKLKLQIELLLNEPETGYVLTMMQNRLVGTTTPPSWIKPEVLSEDQVGLLPSALLVRRRIFAEVGLFNEQLVNASDFEWFIQADDIGISRKVINQVLLQRNIHGENCSYDKKTTRRDLFLILRNKVKSNNAKE